MIGRSHGEVSSLVRHFVNAWGLDTAALIAVLRWQIDVQGSSVNSESGAAAWSRPRRRRASSEGTGRGGTAALTAMRLDSKQGTGTDVHT